jgi:hypothetical protein
MVGNMARRITRDPLTVQIASASTRHENIEQIVHFVDDLSHKNRLLDHLLRDASMDQAVVFTATKRDADTIADRLNIAGFAAAALHGDMNQGARNRTLNGMRRGQVRVLVATDVAARGIDVPGITHVFNYDLPKFPEDYVHRIGRTGRAGRQGTAVSLVNHAEGVHVGQQQGDHDGRMPQGAGGEEDRPPLEGFLEQIALLTDREEEEDRGETLSLMTLHNAKGLEFDSVVVIGCEEGLFPHGRSLDEGGEEEERRLCYVGMTRARRRLAMTWALSRGFHGESGGPSRFLDEIPEELMERQEPDRPPRSFRSYGVPGRVRGLPDSLPPPEPRDPAEIPSVAVGDDVEHESFGEGVVIGTEPGGLIVVRFSTDGTERKLMAEYAPIIRKAG